MDKVLHKKQGAFRHQDWLEDAPRYATPRTSPATDPESFTFPYRLGWCPLPSELGGVQCRKRAQGQNTRQRTRDGLGPWPLAGLLHCSSIDHQRLPLWQACAPQARSMEKTHTGPGSDTLLLAPGGWGRVLPSWVTSWTHPGAT